jgi:hypothetical protein
MFEAGFGRRSRLLIGFLEDLEGDAEVRCRKSGRTGNGPDKTR